MAKKSEKETKETTNNSENETEKKQRGRPKKTIQQQTQQPQQKTKIDLTVQKEKNSVNLHIPLYDDSSSEEESEKNHFNESVEEKKNLIVYLSEEESSDNDNTKTLKKKLKKSEILIKKLKSELTNKSECYNESIYSVSKNTEPNKNTISKMVNTFKDFKVVIGEKTNVACWWCTLQFNNLPCFIPEKYYNNKYYVFGCFCSYNCGLAYIMSDDEYKVPNRVSLIKRLYNELYETDEPLFPSPPKELLAKYGGLLSDEEYRNIIYKLEQKIYKMKILDFCQIPIQFEVINKENNTSKYM
jgi:hypothetical protein